MTAIAAIRPLMVVAAMARASQTWVRARIAARMTAVQRIAVQVKRVQKSRTRVVAMKVARIVSVEPMLGVAT